MTASVSGSGIGDSSQRWARILGVSLRPWSGESPASLLIRGAIQIAVGGFLIWLAVRLATGGELAQYTGEIGTVRFLAVLIAVGAVVAGLLGVLRMGIGVIDLMSTREVTGTVVSLRDRQALDFLPHSVLQLLYHRNPHKLHSRKRRTELVLQTDAGVRQWTVRRRRTVRDLRRGSSVRMTVTPIAGHVSRITPLAG